MPSRSNRYNVSLSVSRKDLAIYLLWLEKNGLLFSSKASAIRALLRSKVQQILRADPTLAISDKEVEAVLERLGKF